MELFDDGQHVLVTIESGKTFTIDIENTNVVNEIPSSFGENGAQSVGLSIDEQFLIVGNQIWDVEQNTKVGEFGLSVPHFIDVQFSPNGKWIATLHEDQSFRVWEADKLFKQDSSINFYNNY